MRKPALALLAVLVACAGLAVSGPAAAHGRVVAHVGIGVGFGPYWGPYWGPWWGPPAYYYPAPVYVAPPEPRVYVERSQVEGTQQQAAAPQQRASTDWWYFCEASRGYYPYVKSCPSGWQRVPPAPPSQ